MPNAISIGSRQAGSAQYPSVLIVSPSQVRLMISARAPKSAAGNSSHATGSPVALTAMRSASRTMTVTG